MITLSIVIPVHNEEGYLKACLDSIANQTVMPDEVIVIDNNSADKTAQIAGGYDFVKVIKENQQGVVFARNKGFNLASGNLIGRIDGDTILSPDWVTSVKESYRAVGSPKLYAATAPPSFRNSGWQIVWRVLHRLSYFWPAQMLMGHTTLVGSNMFITRALWHEVKDSVCLRTDIHEDMDLAYHAKRAGAKVDFSKQLQASVMARKMAQRAILYPKMMLKIRRVDHRLSLVSK